MHPTKRYLDVAARLALRAAGDVEPNPLVGCVIVNPDNQIIGLGHHRRFGGPHAEVEALADCRRRGHDAAGSTVYVTLEPCNAHGKQPPCSDALIAARVGRVIAAQRDPNPPKSGGAARLHAAGIPCDFTDASPLATRLADPFIKRLTTGLPWVIAKWAQTIDGRIATRTGESKWISGPAARHHVHRLRARVDAILTGIGTVLADDPLLTARNVPRIRRVARRVIVDPRLELPLDGALVRSASTSPVLVYTAAAAMESSCDRAGALVGAGVAVHALPGSRGDELPLTDLLRHLHASGVATVLVEAGPRLLGRLFEQDLVDEAIVHIAPLLLGDAAAMPVAQGRLVESLHNGRRFDLCRATRRGADAELVFRRTMPTSPPPRP